MSGRGNFRGGPSRGGNVPRGVAGGGFRAQGHGQGFNQGQGSNQGGYPGGGGRGGSSTSSVKGPLPHEVNKDKASAAPMGWGYLPTELQAIQLPTRTGRAKEFSKKVKISVNHFPVEINLPANIYRYQVSIVKMAKDSTTPVDPRPPPKFMFPALHKNLLAKLRSEFVAKNKGKSASNFGVISDGASTIYSTLKLESTSFQKEVEYVPLPGDDGRKETFLAKIELTEEQVKTKGLQSVLDNMEGQPITAELLALDRIYNTLLKNLSTERFKPVGRSSLIQFDAAHGSKLGKGLMSYSGYDINFDITNGWRPYLNIMVANNATMMSGNVVDVLADLLSRPRQSCLVTSEWKRAEFLTASKFLNNFKVKYSPMPDMTFGGSVTKVSNLSVSEETFMWKEDDKPERQISVYDYYVEKYKRKDLNRNGICLVVNSTNRIPAEICILKQGQSCRRKLEGVQTTEMLKLSKKDPSKLQPEIQRAIVELNLRNDPILSAFGVTLKPDVSMLNMPAARVLAAPQICYAKNATGESSTITPSNGVWDNWNKMTSDLKFFEAAHVDNWAVLFTCRDSEGAVLPTDFRKGYVPKFVSIAKRAGMAFSYPDFKDESDSLRDTPSMKTENIKVLKKVFLDQKAAGYKVVLVIVPTDGSCMYTHVKQSAELYSGLLTQCIKANHFAEPNDSKIKNILLKMNSKLGGINHTVMAPPLTMPFKLFEDPVMILGADVNHPPPGSYNEETGFSYAALVSSYDRTGMRYMTQVKAQKADNRYAKAAEVIKEFDLLMKKSLEQFRIKTSQIPRKIIYFRDGVGDGQFKELLHTEMREIRKACTDLDEKYMPKITFITVQKRHKTRFFFQGVNGTENAPPGTVVDTDIVHPTEIDSFLLSHKGILGTSRPTHYHVLWDDSGFTEDEIQQMTYYLCHMYTRCNRAVSIPAPTFYAHHAAKRANILAEGQRGTVDEINDLLQRTILNASNPMHFT